MLYIKNENPLLSLKREKWKSYAFKNQTEKSPANHHVNSSGPAGWLSSHSFCCAWKPFAGGWEKSPFVFLDQYSSSQLTARKVKDEKEKEKGRFWAPLSQVFKLAEPWKQLQANKSTDRYFIPKVFIILWSFRIAFDSVLTMNVQNLYFANI